MSDEIAAIGTKLDIHMGYKDAVKKIMVGEVTGVKASFLQNDVTTTLIKGHCRLHRLTRGKRTFGINMPGEMLTESNIVQIYAAKNGFIPVVDVFGVKKHLHLQRDMTDFEYILDIALRNNRRIACWDRYLFMLPMLPRRKESALLEWGKTLVKFDVSLDSRRLFSEVEVRSHNVRTGQGICATADMSKVLFRIGGLTMGASISEKAFGKNKAIIVDHNVQDIMSAEIRAINYLTEKNLEYISGWAACQGNPGIRAGSFAKLKGLGEKFSGIYYIMEVKHSITPWFGFETEFEVVRNALDKKPKLLDIFSRDIMKQLAESAGVDKKTIEKVGNAVDKVEEVVETVGDAVDHAKEFKDILERARERAKEMVETVKKEVYEKVKRVLNQIKKYKRDIEATIKEFREYGKIVEEAPKKLQEKVTSYQNMANLMLTRMNNTITNIKNRKESIKAEVEKKIKEAEEGNYPQEEIDRVKEESDQQLQAYDDEIEEAEKLLKEYKE
jgi:hypothetical protein